MLALLLFVIGSLGIGFSAVVFRADPCRHDNRLFALIAGIDALTAFTRALFVSQGYALSDPFVLQVMTILSVAIGMATIEFTYAFPGGAPLPAWARWLNLAYGALAIAWPIVMPGRVPLISKLYFLPAFAVTLVFLARSYRRLGGAGGTTSVKLVMLALALRWTAAQIAYDVAITFEPTAFRAILTCDATVAVLASQILIGYAVLVGHLFRVRSFLAEVLVLGSFVLAVTALTGSLIELGLEHASHPLVLRGVLFVAALVPLALAYGARRFRGRLESALIGPLDPRRATRETCLERYMQKVERSDVATLFLVAKQTLADMTLGGRARFLAVKPTEGADGLLDSEIPPDRTYLHVPGGPLQTPVRVAGELAGAFVIDGGLIDRDTVLTAVTLSKHVGLRMENQSLVAELEESKRLAALGSFAAAIAHDIRTPLTSVQMNVQILRKKVSLPPSDMEHFDIALDELKRLGAHVAELLDYAKPIRVEPVAMPARELADEAARGLAPLLAERDVRVVVEDEGAPAVLVDPMRIRQVLLNLLDNAAHASARGATITVKVCPAPDARVAFEVKDAGKGIEPAHLARIFEPFFTTRPDGTGLGLAIVQKHVRAHGGEVSARSIVGQGTTVTVLLPAVT